MPALRPFARSKAAVSYWNCRLTGREMILLAAAICLSLALHLTPVLEGGLGLPLIIALAATCFLSPFTGFFFIGACSILPFPEAMANEIMRTEGTMGPELGSSPAKIGIIVWFFVILIRYRRISLTGITKLWPVLPWLIWFTVITGEQTYLPGSEYMKALMYSVMACQLANEARGEYLKCLMGLCLGALVVMVAFWGVSAGLPIGISNWGSTRGGLERIGGVRADAVMVWPAILMGLAGMMGVSLVLRSKVSPVRPPRWLTFAAITLVICAIPPMVATMTHGAYAGIALLACAFAACVFLLSMKGFLTRRQINAVLLGCAVVVGVVVVLYSTNALQIRTRAETLAHSYRETAEEEGIAASRTSVWHDSINTIMEYPLLGYVGNRAQETITSGFADSGFYLSHNVFFDYGRYCGIPGMLLLAFFFFWPAVQMLQRADWVRYLPFLLMLFAVFIFWMSLSFQFYKTFWALWMLMAMAVIPRATQVRATRRRPRTVTKAVPVPALAQVTPRPVGHAQGGQIKEAV